MKKTILTLSALALAVSLGANAQVSGEVSVAGTISPSTSCTFSLSSNQLTAPQMLFPDLERLEGDSMGLEQHFQPELLTLDVECPEPSTYELTFTTPTVANNFRRDNADPRLVRQRFLFGGDINSGYNAFPLLIGGQQAAWLHLGFNAPFQVITEDKGRLINARTPTDGLLYPTYNAEVPLQPRKLRVQYVDQPQRFTYGGVWSVNDQLLNSTDVNLLTNSITVQIDIL